jgi:flagellar protein FlgJ
MSLTTDTSQSLAIDANGLSALRRSAEQNSPEALKGAAKQFEAVFMNMMLKSMRDATPQDGALDSDQSRMYTSMLDQQLSQNLASRGVGLADMLVKQLSGSLANQGAMNGQSAQSNPLGNATNAASASRGDTGTSSNVKGKLSQPAHIRAFKERLSAGAEEASRTTGIPAKFMLGQAALETGWGKREIKSADGSNSHNVFGIKATGGWKGKVVTTATTEYVNGVPHTKMEKFRAYDSYADAFKDYASLLQKNPRYQAVLANAQDAVGFAKGLQRAGYATDPHYAAKLAHIITKSLSA